MKTRPILFQAEMVRAILSGAKTQTRRALRHQPVDGDRVFQFGYGFSVGRLRDSENAIRPITCPYGVPEDRLWVRETCHARETNQGLDGVRYVADGDFREIEDTREAADAWVVLNHYGRRSKGAVVPAIHMPRWASRITLEITDVRVERVQDISEADALAEGIDDGYLVRHHLAPPRATVYRYLWEDINGPESWERNDWCWCVSFRRI